MKQDPWDDGGTPAYRRRIIDARRPGLIGRWKRLSLYHQAILILACIPLSVAIVIVPLAVIAIGMRLGLWQ